MKFFSQLPGQPEVLPVATGEHKTPYPASDIAFVNNLVRGGPFVSGQNSAWSIEFGGPALGDIAFGVPLTAGHGLNLLHNTFRNLFDEMLHPSGHPSAFCDIRYNITYQTFNWLNTANVTVDYPNLLMASNRFIGGLGNRPAYVSADQEFATDAAAGLGNAAAGDAGGASHADVREGGAEAGSITGAIFRPSGGLPARHGLGLPGAAAGLPRRPQPAHHTHRRGGFGGVPDALNTAPLNT
jgi:hypothetical protein